MNQISYWWRIANLHCEEYSVDDPYSEKTIPVELFRLSFWRTLLFVRRFFFITMTIVWWLKQSLIEIARNFWVTKTNKRASLSNLKWTTTANWMISLAILLSQLQEYVKKKNIPKTWQRFTKVSGNHCSSG